MTSYVLQLKWKFIHHFTTFICISCLNPSHPSSAIVNMTSDGRDVVYAGDIELAIEYALNTEIPSMGEITLEKMPTLYQFLVSTLRY